MSIDYFEDLDVSPTWDQIEEILDEIKGRCDTAKIKYEDDSSTDDEIDINITIHMPCGRETRAIYLLDYDDLVTFKDIEFEKFTLLGNYAAICTYKEGIIEAVISAPSISKSPFQRRRTLKQLGILPASQKTTVDFTLVPPSGAEGVQLKLRNVSRAAQILSQASDPLSLSLELTCLKVTTHDEAMEILNRMSNALFFDIDLQKGVHLSLLRKPQRQHRFGFIENEHPIGYPKNAYDEAPMALYWYARSATNMPLLQFLAYYQTIEFYYPVFYNAEVSRRVRSMIKNPGFRVDSESDISKIVSTIRTRGLGFASEKDQLRATIRECIENEDIAEFLAQSEKRAEFFLSKAKGITSHVLNPQSKGHDLCSQSTDRIYDIRCKIVHIKGDEGDGDLELLLPYSKEAEKLGHDIELVRLIAQKVLVYASKEMRGAA